jgi:copper chaperone
MEHTVTTTVISVPEVHCGHCVSSIEGALAPMDGVSEATVSLEATNVTVQHDDTVSVAQLEAAIEEQGYEVAR